jgi:hypothetical protein
MRDVDMKSLSPRRNPSVRIQQVSTEKDIAPTADFSPFSDGHSIGPITSMRLRLIGLVLASRPHATERRA